METHKKTDGLKNAGSRNLIEHDLTLESIYFQTFDLSTLGIMQIAMKEDSKQSLSPLSGPEDQTSMFSLKFY